MVSLMLFDAYNDDEAICMTVLIYTVRGLVY